MNSTARSRTRAAQQRGFTLVELLVVIAMVGVLASIAIIGYRKYLHGAHTGDAKAIMSAIKVAQESSRAETLNYTDCTGNWYPNALGPNGNKFHFLNPGHPNFACWRGLNVAADSPTRFTFVTRAAGPPNALPAPSEGTWASFPATPANLVEPAYFVEAVGDADNNLQRSRFVTTSFNGEIYVEQEYE